MSKPSERQCPFCGTTIDLAECRVVSTVASLPTARPALSGVGGQHGLGDLTFPEDDVENAGGRSVTPAGTVEPGGAGEVLFDPTAIRQPTRSWTTVLLPGPRYQSLSEFPQHLVPRRQCAACGEHLPPEMESRRTRIFSVVGLNAAGKSNYLASALTLARQGGLADFGITEFTPGLDTANRFQTDFYIRLFREREVLAGTSLDLEVARKPLSFKVTPAGGEPFLMMTHDVAGEALIDHRVRSLSAGFVRRSVGVIFLLDPLEFDPVRARVLPELVPPSRAIDQADLLDHVLQELSYRLRGDNIPLAIVVGKADLLTPAIVGGGSFHEERPAGDAVKPDVATVNSEVKDLLVALGQRRIVELGERHGVTTFHAVSSLGGTERDLVKYGVRPRRVLDPLGVVLSRFAARAATA